MSSTLTRLECARTLDRARLTGTWLIDTLLEYQTAVEAVLAAINELEISTVVLGRAREPLPVPLATLDALHLSSALLWRDQYPEEEVVFATHDHALGRAARIMGLTVIGVE